MRNRLPSDLHQCFSEHKPIINRTGAKLADWEKGWSGRFCNMNDDMT